MSEISRKEIAKERWDICTQCPRFFKPTGTCKECGCFMRIKTQIPSVKCPIGKW